MARVLVVDDDRATRDMVRAILEDDGHLVHDAVNGSEALSLLRLTPHPVVVLLGGMMPVMNGFETIEAVLRDERLARQHIYIPMSANAGFPPWVRKRLGIPDLPLLIKPFSVTSAVDAVGWAIRRLELAA